jgi:site-specific recombinase XerD
MKARISLLARVKDSKKASGYRLDTMTIKRGRPVSIPDATTYYLRYQSNGKRVVKPVGSDLDIAFVAYENHVRNHPALQRGEEITPGETKDFQNASGPTLREALETYVQELQGKTEATIYSYRSALEEFIRHCGEHNPISETGRPCLLSYKTWLYKQDLNETTRHARLLRAVMFLKHFGIEKPLKKTDWPRPNERPPEAYSQDEIEKMFAVATPEERLLIEFFLTSGARNAEVQHTVRADIKLSKTPTGELAVLTIREKPEMDWRTKSKKDRTVRLPLDFTKRLLTARAGCSDGDLLFPNTQGGPNCHFDVILRRVTKKAGLRGRVDLHKFRSTFATRLHAAGVPVQDIQKMLGHRDIKTTMRYLAATAHESEATGKAIEAAFGDFGATEIRADARSGI